MRIAVIGGGPAGLFFARLMMMQNPEHEIDLFEQNPRNATYGFGVVFTERALWPVLQADKELYDAIVAASERQEHITVHHRNTPVRVVGNVYFGIARAALLEVMQEHCEQVGVRIHFESRIEGVKDLADYDLVVGADGINSAVRGEFAGAFGDKKEARQNYYAWYASTNLVEGLNLIFRQTDHGLFIGHTYRYADDRSGFVVECSPETLQAAGLEQMSDEESRSYCENIFEDLLDGGHLLSNRSTWFKPEFVTCDTWFIDNVVLIGDALNTAHPSIGSGTRFGMQDAIALAAAFEERDGDVSGALELFVKMRRRKSDALQLVAMRSIIWYETVEEKLGLSPVDFAFSFMMRTGRVDYERLREMDREYVRAYETAPSELLAEIAK